jgi:hypothetical protein
MKHGKRAEETIHIVLSGVFKGIDLLGKELVESLSVF